jgi:hypothetical protein
LLTGGRVHNGAVKQRLGVLVSVLVMSCATLAGCSGDSDDPGDTESQSPSASPTPTEEPYIPVPEDVSLTEQGSALMFGEEAVVGYRPRQGVVAVLSVTVDRVRRTTFTRSFAGWKLDQRSEKMTPYFVTATITNVGETDLGGRQVPLYGVDSGGRLIEASTFKGEFTPCPSRPFPKVFGTGATYVACLVYLTPPRTRLESVSFRPSQDFNPITWTGTITDVPADKPAKPKKGKGKGKGAGAA